MLRISVKSGEKEKENCSNKENYICRGIETNKIKKFVTIANVKLLNPDLRSK